LANIDLENAVGRKKLGLDFPALYGNLIFYMNISVEAFRKY
jgi:hypothetical protein